MATTRNSRTSSSAPTRQLAISSPTPSPEPEQPSVGSKVAGAAKRFALPLYLAVVGVITWIFLWTSAMTVGPFGKLSYPDTIARIVTASLIVSLIPAIVLLVLKRDKRYSYTLIRVVAIIVSVLFCFLFLAIVIRWAGSMGVGNTTFAESLMGMAGIPGVLAIVCLGLFAFFLAHYKEDDGSLDTDKQELAGIDDELRAATAEHTKAQRELTVRRERNTLAHDQVTKLENEATDLSDTLEEARKNHNDSKANQDLKDARDEQATLQKEYDTLSTEIDDLKVAKKAADKAGDDTKMQSIIRRLKLREDRYGELEELLDAYNPKGVIQKVKDCEKAVESSTEAKNFKAATDAHDAKTKELQKARENAEAAEKRLDEGEAVVAEKAAHVEAHKTRRAQLDDSVASADKADRSVWRDLVFPLAVTFILAVLFFPTWQGYVMTALY